MSLNFDNVESASANVSTESKESQFKIVKPGEQDLMIESVEPIVAQSTGNAGLAVSFASKEAEASFTERFWLSAGALPRVQYLVEKFTGAKMTGAFDGEGLALAQTVATALAPKLVGKSKRVIVDGEKRTRDKDGKVYENIYPVLRFAGFVEPEGDDAKPRITDKTASVPAKAAFIDDSTTNDLPF